MFELMDIQNGNGKVSHIAVRNCNREAPNHTKK